MKTTIKSIVCTVIGLLVGLGLGYVLPGTKFNEGSGKGDVTKVSKYSKNVVSPQASAFQEKIMNDSDAFEKAKASLTLLSARMNDFDALVDFAVKSGAGIEELAPVIDKIDRISKLAANAKATANDAAEAFNNMTENKKGAAADYETASQNLSLTYLLVDRQINVGKEYVSSVDAFLKGKKAEDYPALACSRDLWAGYCAGQAALNGDGEELDYWSGKDYIVNSDNLGQALIMATDQIRVVRAGHNYAEILNAQENIGAVLNLLIPIADRGVLSGVELRPEVKNAIIEANANIGANAVLGAKDVIEANAAIGAIAVIGAIETLQSLNVIGAYDDLGAGEKLGSGAILNFANIICCVLPNSVIGNEQFLGANIQM